MFVFAGCSSSKATSQPAGTILKSLDKNYAFQVTVPDAWKENKELHTDAVIAAGINSKELYFMLIPDHTDTLPDKFNLQQYADIALKIMTDNLANAETSFVKDLKIGSYDAKQYTVKGVANGMKVKYLVTVIKTEKHYAQMTAWTLESDYNAALPVFEKIVSSFAKIK